MRTKRSVFVLIVLAVVAALSMAMIACGEKDETPGTTDEPVFSLDKTSITITVDANELLTLTIENVNETPQWSSSNESIATVTPGSSANKATVKGIGVGNAVISVSAGDQIALCTVKVNAAPKLELVTESPLSILAGRTALIQVETDIEELSYESDNTSVATVNADGLVTGVKGGTAHITVSGAGKEVKCTVVVTDPTAEIEESLALLSLEDGKNTVQLHGTSNGTLQWSSSDENVATVNQSGLVTAKAVGEAVITAAYGKASDTCTVKVKGELITVTLDPAQATMRYGEDPVTLEATVTPEQQGDKAGVTWTVESGSDLVSVSEDGVVTVISEESYGKAVVRATSKADADAYAECEITVPSPLADWIAVSNAADLKAALVAGNENSKIYLTGDVDMDGESVTAINFAGTLDGKGYSIKKLTGKLFGGIAETGSVMNLDLESDISGNGTQGVFGLSVAGKVENCVITVIVGNGPGACPAIAEQGANSMKVLDTVILIHNPDNWPATFGGLGSPKKGDWTGAYCATLDNNINTATNGPTYKTLDELKAAALYEDYDEDVWNIVDGQLPALRNAENPGDVKVVLDVVSATSYVGDSLELTATVIPSALSAQDREVTWSTSDAEKATVENGVVTMTGEGTVTITATSKKDNTKSASCEITVESATEVTLASEATLKLEIGGESQIEASSNRTGDTLTYTSNDTGVVTVSDGGIIHAVAVGTTTVTVKSTVSPNKTATVTVTVMPEVELALTGEAAVSMEIGEDYTIEISNNREDDTVTWLSSDANIATVDSDGKVHAVAAGTVTVTGTSTVDSSKTVTVTVTVQPEITISVVGTLSIQIDTPVSINATVSRGGMTYESSDTSIVTVDDQGNVTGIAAGSADVTVTSVIDDSKTAVCHITVAESVTVTLTLDRESATLDWGETLTLIATVNVPGVEWTSSDETVATVSDSGAVTALNKNGTTTITATSTADGNVSATCEITVTYVAPVIELTDPTAGSTVNLEIGGTQTIAYTLSKGEATVEIVDTNGDPVTGVVSYDADTETLTADGAGEAVVKVVTVNAETSAEIAVSFNVKVWVAPTITIDNAPTDPIIVGNTAVLGYTSNRTGTVAWESSNESVATVATDGTVTAIKAGNTTVKVTITTEYGAKADASVEITVNDAPEVSYALDARSVKVDGSYAPEITVKGGTATYESSNTAVATVAEDGTITGVAQGKATITATVGDKTATILIDVYVNKGETEISTAAQLKGLDNGKFVMVNDIDFSGVEVTNNYVSENFQGSLDGRGYALKNITTNFTAAEQGMFGMINGLGIVQNVNFIDFTLGGSDGFTHGGLIREVNGSAVVRNCYFEGVITARGAWVGTIGSKWSENATIENCIFNVELKGAATAATSNPRLAIGRWFNGEVKNCFAVKVDNVFAAGNGNTNEEKYAEALKTLDDLKKDTSYDDSWETAWVIINGQLPVLKNVRIDEPVRVKLSASTLELNVSQTGTLTATVLPNTTEDKTVTYTSSNDAVATVAEDGTVTAVAAGSAVITATSNADSTKSASCSVTVKEIELSIDSESVPAEVGVERTAKLTATVSYGDIEWSTSDADIADVDPQTGVVTGKAAGTVTITATSKANTAVSDSVTITVAADVEIVVTLDKPTLRLAVGTSETLTPTVTGSANGVTWSSDNEEIATVDNNGKVTAVGAGDATITATSADDTSKTATCAVTVYQPTVEISLNSAGYTVGVGGNVKAAAIVKNTSDGSILESAVAWSSADENIATVGDDGTINGVALGMTTITATSGGESITAQVEVITPKALHPGNPSVSYDYSPVSTVDELKTALGKNDGKFYLTNDIDFAGTVYDTSFAGTMVNIKVDGRGHSLKNIKTNFSANDIGFINMLDGTTEISNINFVGFDIGGTSGFMYGGLIGQITANAILRDCYFEGIISARRDVKHFVGTIGTMHTPTCAVTNCIFNVGFGNTPLNATAVANPKVIAGRRFNSAPITAFVNKTLIGDKPVHVANLNGAEQYADALKTEEELKTAATYSAWTTSSWDFVDGQMPKLKVSAGLDFVITKM